MNRLLFLMRGSMVLSTAAVLFVVSDVDAGIVTYQWTVNSPSTTGSISWDSNAAVQNPDPFSNGNATEYVVGTLVVDNGPFSGTYGAAAGGGGNIRVVDNNLNAGNFEDQFLMQFFGGDSLIVNFSRFDGAAWNTQSLNAVSDQLIPLSQWDTATIKFEEFPFGFTELNISVLTLVPEPSTSVLTLAIGLLGLATMRRRR